MSKTGLQKLRNLGYEFWVPVNKKSSNTGSTSLYLLFKSRVLLACTTRESDLYPRFISSLARTLDPENKSMTEIAGKELTDMKFNLVIDIQKDLKLESKSSIQFDSISQILESTQSKKNLWSELINFI